MNDGTFEGLGSGSIGVLRRPIWQFIDYTQTIPIRTNAAYFSAWIIGGGGGGGGGRFGVSTNGGGGGGGSGGATYILTRIPVSLLLAFNISRVTITIGAGGSGGTGGTTDAGAVGAGVNGGSTTLTFGDVSGAFGTPITPVHTANNGAGGSAGATTLANGGTGATATSGLPSITGGNGSAVATGAFPVYSTANFPSAAGVGGGGGGSAKGINTAPHQVFGHLFGSSTQAASLAVGNSVAGADAIVTAREFYNALEREPRVPDPMTSWFLKYGGGGGGSGGNTSTNTAGGNGVAILCWEFQ